VCGGVGVFEDSGKGKPTRKIHFKRVHAIRACGGSIFNCFFKIISHCVSVCIFFDKNLKLTKKSETKMLIILISN